MGNLNDVKSGIAVRIAFAAVLAAVVNTAGAAVVSNSSSSTLTLPPGWTANHGPVWAPSGPFPTAPIIVGPIDPTPISPVPSPPTIFWPNPLLPFHPFPVFPVAPTGPVWNPPAPTLSTTAASTPPTASAADVATVVNGNNQFAYDLYGALNATNTGNMVFSPYSISTALAMTYAGAAGQTATQMAQTLHFTLPESQLAPAMGQLIGETNTSGGTSYQLSVANHLWGQTGVPFLSSFVNTTSADYQAPLTQLDFYNNPDGSRQTINTWTANQTNQKIQNLLPPGSISSLSALVLTNAVYFKAGWQSPFNPTLTQSETFYLSSGSLESVPMMHQERTFKYAAFQNYSMLDLPYAGGDISMLAILPSQTSSLTSVENSLNAQTLTQDENQLTTTRVQVGLPKFTMTSQFNLGTTLASMGMPSAFDQHRANFSGMSPVPLHVSAVVHKAFISVDEQGTEAAGATAVVMAEPTFVTSELASPAIFDAVRPFDFVLRDDKTGSILFMGRVSDPGGTPIVTPLPADTFFSPISSGTSDWLADSGSGGTFVNEGALAMLDFEPAKTFGQSMLIGPPVLSPSFSGTLQLPASNSMFVASAVPEPSTLALLFSAVAAVATQAFQGRLRRRQQSF